MNAKTIDAIALLTTDHREVKDLFEQFDKLGDKAYAKKKNIAEEICTALTLHAMVEEEIFYPAVRGGAKDAEDLLDEAEVEHDTVRALIQKLESMDPSDEKRKAHFTVLMEYVKHHVKEEEKEMFPKVKKLKSLDLNALGAQMKERKSALMGEMGIEVEEEQEETA